MTYVMILKLNMKKLMAKLDERAQDSSDQHKVISEKINSMKNGDG